MSEEKISVTIEIDKSKYETILKSHDVFKFQLPCETLESYLGDLVVIGFESLIETTAKQLGIEFPK